MNKIQLVGRLTKDPELTFAPGTGTAVTKFTLAVNRPQFDKSKQQEADFIPCVCFGKRAEAIANYVQKGHRFGLSGRLQINKYVDKEGNNRWSTDVVVEDFEFLQDKGARINESQSNESSVDYEKDLTPVDDGDIPF
ncbi:single-stranded DNA-binding protein [Clostridium botulinum]|uniref:Single-stranded DNA-binding protein n=1 Tax=Clostridium botulinum TaxID=1491 RepID=A0A846J473_CLOBO|nr:single-stranded DNA-binding protein [Clostridium botulinum]ACA55718.1 single-strand binding family protein [Clostridium botulinum A3 str. Loch Maree]NFH66155.1 single-stranded DNA-binding protein [Clostridium botulinum]NFJ08698.1 single-stranded DNA-binding protein [Clostridium botulinum]NFK15094.1 single-stranded DNA-binding protein [Clostridium botulinum]NFM93054.1 single-stranded DNA-binding protein [Clostridium botulinum]